MSINRSALILCSNNDEFLDESRRKLIEYKNKRYLEMVVDSVADYEDIVISSSLNRRFRYNNFSELRIDKETLNLLRIYDGLKKCKYQKVLVISCNTPLVGRQILNDLGKINFTEQILVPYAKGKLQKYCAIYDKSILNDLKQIILKRNQTLNDLYENVKVRYMFPKNEEVFANVELIEHF